MNRHVKMGALAVFACSAAVALGYTYRWVDNGPDHNWETAGNWLVLSYPGASYPRTTDDRARILYNDGDGWTIEQETYHIGEMTIAEDVTFTGSATLTTDVLIFDATDGQIDVHLEDGMLVANPH